MSPFSFRVDSKQMTSEITKFGVILLLSSSLGILSSVYPPLFTLAGTAFFTILSVTLYVSSYSLKKSIPNTESFSISESESRILFYLFYLSFFLSITIPKSGKTIANIPVTTANMCLLLTLTFWILRQIFSQRTIFALPEFKPLLMLISYGGAIFLLGLLNNNPKRGLILDFVAFIGFVPVYFLVCSVVRTQSHIHKIIKVIVLSSVIVCIYGVLQTQLGFERIALPGITEQHGKIMYEGVGRWNTIEGGASKVYSTFQNGNIFGNHLTLIIPFLAGVYIGIRTFWKKIAFLGIFLLSWYVLILTYSRGAMVGTISGMFIFGVISKKIRLKAIIAIILVLTLLFIFLQHYADRPELVRYNFRRITTDPNQFSAGRLERAQEVIRGFYNLPPTSKLFGLGFGGMLTSPRGWVFNHVDNLYLTLLFKMGIVGIILLFLTLLHILVTLLKLRSNCPDLKTQAFINGGIAGLIGSLVHNLADTLWFFPPLSTNFWFFTGFVMMIGVIGANESQTVSSSVSKNPIRTTRKK